MNAPDLAASSSAARQRFYDDIRAFNLAPLWESLHALVPKQPAPTYLPFLWRYRDLRSFLVASASLITAHEAVRRVLILENPALPGSSSITQSLYAGLQVILPGEVAPSHRHVQSALRFIVEGSGAYTTVNGERTTMHPGDFIITPSWNWHDHGNDGSSEMVVWLDGLDIPMIQYFGAGFAENDENVSQQVTVPEGHSFARFGYNMAPVKNLGSFSASPIFNYPYARSREALDTLRKSEAHDPWHGYKLRYVNPLTGGSPMSTIATFLQLLPEGFAGQAHRCTDGTVYSVVEGRGKAIIAGQEFSFEPRDTFVVPSWSTLELKSDEEAVLFSFSDRPMQMAAGILRESFLNTAQ